MARYSSGADTLYVVHETYITYSVGGARMVRFSVTEARDKLSELCNRVSYQGERIVLDRRGKAVAVLISLEDLEVLERAEDAADLQSAREAVAESETEGTVSLDDLREELGL
ncbi:MAG: type II toxin-antitoxin system Phd/YefM family antitoxin [Candidatus Eisenbacteria bacterium]